MPLFKSADTDPKNEVIIFDELPHPGDVVEMHHPQEMHHPGGFSFDFPNLPDSKMIEVSEEGPKHTHDPKEKKPKDRWDHGDMSNLMNWVQERLNNIPDMSGNETTAIERAISYLKRLNGEISKAISNDYDGEIDVKTMEVARKWIFTAIKTLQSSLDEIYEAHKKSSDNSSGMVKEARTPYTGGIIVTVPLIISRCARVCINGTVSAGHDLPKLYAEQVKKYSLDVREQAELCQHLSDMGFPLREDRLFLPTEEVTVENGRGDLASNYYA